MTETSTPPDQPPDHKQSSRIWVWLGVTVAVVSALPWLYAIFAGDQPHANDYLDDRTFPEAAEPICASAMAKLSAFPLAKDSKDPTERSKVIEQTTAVLETMVRDLRSVVPDTDDATWINTWLDHWQFHLNDRHDFAKRLTAAGGEREEFFETPVGGHQVSKSIDGWAIENKMESCKVPQDV